MAGFLSALAFSMIDKDLKFRWSPVDRGVATALVITGWVGFAFAIAWSGIALIHNAMSFIFPKR